MEKHKHGGDIYSREIAMDYSANISPLGLSEGVPWKPFVLLWNGWCIIRMWNVVLCGQCSLKSRDSCRFYPLRKRSGRADLRTGKRMQTEEGSGGGTRLCRVRTGTFRLRL